MDHLQRRLLLIGIATSTAAIGRPTESAAKGARNRRLSEDARANGPKAGDVRGDPRTRSPVEGDPHDPAPRDAAARRRLREGQGQQS